MQLIPALPNCEVSGVLGAPYGVSSATLVAELPDDAKPGEPMRVAVPKMEAFKDAVEKMHEASGLEGLDK